MLRLTLLLMLLLILTLLLLLMLILMLLLLLMLRLILRLMLLLMLMLLLLLILMLILLLFPPKLPLPLPRLQSVSVSLLPLPSPTIVTLALAPLHPLPPSLPPFTTSSPFLRDHQFTLARYANKNTKAIGDIRQGEGTIGGKPPEAILGSQVRAHPSQDVHAVGHFVWQTFCSPELFSQNVWLNPVSGLVLLIFVTGVMFWREVEKSIHVHELSGRI